MEALKASAENYSGVALMGFMTVSLMMALILIGLGVRFVRALIALKTCDEALEKVRSIEETLTEMTATMREVEMDYERNLAEEKSAHEREVFALQQIIFDRNSDILTLKTDILEMKKTQQFDTL